MIKEKEEQLNFKDVKKEWEAPQMVQLNIKETASGTGDKKEDHPVFPHS